MVWADFRPQGSQEICQRLFGDRHGTMALGGLALARCFRGEGTVLAGDGTLDPLGYIESIWLVVWLP